MLVRSVSQEFFSGTYRCRSTLLTANVGPDVDDICIDLHVGKYVQATCIHGLLSSFFLLLSCKSACAFSLSACSRRRRSARNSSIDGDICCSLQCARTACNQRHPDTSMSMVLQLRSIPSATAGLSLRRAVSAVFETHLDHPHRVHDVFAPPIPVFLLAH